MKRLLTFLLFGFSSFVFAQAPNSYIGVGTVNGVPKICNYGSLNTYCPSNISDNGNNLLYNGITINTSTAKVVNGVSICANYPGVTVAEQINNCNADALALSNGNTSGIIDLRGLGGNHQFDTQIFIGDTSGDPVTAIFPGVFNWTVANSFSSTTLCGLRAGKNVSLIGSTPGADNSGVITISQSYTGTGLYALMCTDNTVYGSLVIDGVGFEQEGPASFSGHAIDIEDTYDNIYLKNTGVNDKVSSGTETAFYTKGLCCAGTFINVNINCNYNAGCTPLVEDATGGSSLGESQENWYSPSIDHPGVGLHAWTIQDSRVPPTTSVNIFGGYTELNTSDTTTSAVYLSSVGTVNVWGYKVQYEDNASTAPAFEINYGAEIPSINIAGLSIFNAITTPVVCAVKRDVNSLCYSSDSYGLVPQYSLSGGTIYKQSVMDVFNSFNVLNNIPAAIDGSSNQSSPFIAFGGQYGTGSASAPDSWKWQDVFGTGTNPTITNTLSHSGSTGLASVSIPFPVLVNALNQVSAGNWAGQCTMSTTTCTVTLAHTFATPICVANLQGTGTVIAGECSVSGTTVTVTAASSNTGTWAVAVFGNPN